MLCVWNPYSEDVLLVAPPIHTLDKGLMDNCGLTHLF
jgi:hypothetical protein